MGAINFISQGLAIILHTEKYTQAFDTCVNLFVKSTHKKHETNFAGLNNVIYFVCRSV